jgi:hypothetical protein
LRAKAIDRCTSARQMTGGFFHGESAVGITAAHRFNLARPVVVFGSYANGGGSEHVGKIGAGFES